MRHFFTFVPLVFSSEINYHYILKMVSYTPAQLNLEKKLPLIYVLSMLQVSQPQGSSEIYTEQIGITSQQQAQVCGGYIIVVNEMLILSSCWVTAKNKRHLSPDNMKHILPLISMSSLCDTMVKFNDIIRAFYLRKN